MCFRDAGAAFLSLPGVPTSNTHSCSFITHSVSGGEECDYDDGAAVQKWGFKHICGGPGVDQLQAWAGMNKHDEREMHTVSENDEREEAS